MFLDHYKPAYTSDLKLCEHLNLVTPGTVLAADNVIKPGNPPYLEYVRSSIEEKRRAAAKEMTNGFDVKAKFGRNADMYQQREGEEKIDDELEGNPNLVYESNLVNSYEPTGEPVRERRPISLLRLPHKEEKTSTLRCVDVWWSL
ncbi:MAG: hypothetical protein Q9180_007628 [Flavoplaca navasiana]